MAAVVMSIAGFLVGVAKTGIAGLVILPVAIFASVLPARESVGVALIVLIAGDVMAVLIYRHDAQWALLWRLFPSTAVGVLVGAATINQIDDADIRRLIGIILIGLLSIHLTRQMMSKAKGDPAEDSVPASIQRPWVAVTTGMLAGFTTMVANASGPIMVLYLLAHGLSKTRFIGTTAWFFLILNLFKLPFAISLDLITPSSLVTSLWVLPLTVVGALAGRWILRKLDEHRFERLALGLTWIAGVRLIV